MVVSQTVRHIGCRSGQFLTVQFHGLPDVSPFEQPDSARSPQSVYSRTLVIIGSRLPIAGRHRQFALGQKLPHGQFCFEAVDIAGRGVVAVAVGGKQIKSLLEVGASRNFLEGDRCLSVIGFMCYFRYAT